MLPYLDKTSTRPELKKVALTPTSERRTFWRGPSTWKIRSSKGFWRSILLPELQDESKRQESKAAFGRYLARRRGGRNRTAGNGLLTETEMDTFPPVNNGHGASVSPNKRGKRRVSANSNNSGNIGARKVIVAKRMSQSERNQAMANAPVDSTGKPFCWDFNSKLGCCRGQGCPNAHAVFKNKNLHWTIEAELARRGGHRYEKQGLPLEKADTRVEQLRNEKQRKIGEQMNESKRMGRNTTPERTDGKPPSRDKVFISQQRDCTREYSGIRNGLSRELSCPVRSKRL